MQKCIEGAWIEDEEGVWVFMPPKLFFYVNYVTIVTGDGDRILPWLRDIEWIFFTYWMCCEGFSGFEKDDKYTSHYLAKKAADGTIDDIEKEKIPPSCYNKKKELKEYVDPWVFLTRTYLIDDPRGNLGRPLYSPSKKKKGKDKTGILDTLNRQNAIILGARGLGKTLSFFEGVVYHEFLFGGVKFMEDIDNTSRELLMGLGCATKDQLQRSINSIKSFHFDHPGKYEFEDSRDATYMGPFYKNVKGSFKVGQTVTHEMKGGAGGNRVELSGAVMQMGVIEPNRTTLGAGGRSRIIAIEEFGFLGKLALEVYNATRDSLKVNQQKVGHLICLGTAGDIKKIEGPKQMFEDPESFETFGIPNYWAAPRKKIGLFMPVLYQYRDYEDDQGNINIKAALERYIADKKLWAETMDTVALTSQQMFNPLVPRDMLIPNTRSILPKREAQNQLADIEEQDLFPKFANAGELRWDKSEKYGVKFHKDMDGYGKAITDYANIDFDKIDKSGRLVVFEPPKEYIPVNTYFVCFDPTKPKDDDGTSLNGLIVYKHFNTNGGWLSDGIAAVWCGRMGSLAENYEQVIKIAKYFNARIFVETNTGGFVNWCRDKGYFDMLQSDSYRWENETGKGKWKRNYHQVGCNLTGPKKAYAIKALRDWLNTVRNKDSVTGAPTKKNINYIFSKRILNEITHHNPGGNYDLLSGMYLLMILFHQLDYLEPEDNEMEYEHGYSVKELNNQKRQEIRDYSYRRPSLFESI